MELNARVISHESILRSAYMKSQSAKCASNANKPWLLNL